MSIHFIRLLCLGECNVGKTSLINKFLGDSCEDVIPTVGIVYSSKSFLVHTNVSATIQIWDFSGKDQEESYRRAFYSRAHGIVFVFDVTRLESYHKVLGMIEEIRRESTAQMFVCGNKIDIPFDEWQVNRQNIQADSQQFCFTYFEVSALATGEIVNAFFSAIACKIENTIIESTQLEQKQAKEVIQRKCKLFSEVYKN